MVRRGDPDASLLVLVNGRLRAGSVSSDGREITIGVMEPGTVVGEIALLDGRPRSMDVTAMLDSTLLVVERREFLPFLCARPDLMLRVMALLCDRLRRASKAFEDVALAPLSARLARLLLGLAEEHGVPGDGGTRIRLKLSQKDMSAQVAATRERVNKQLRQWHEAGVLGEQDGDWWFGGRRSCGRCWTRRVDGVVRLDPCGHPGGVASWRGPWRCGRLR